MPANKPVASRARLLLSRAREGVASVTAALALVMERAAGRSQPMTDTLLAILRSLSAVIEMFAGIEKGRREEPVTKLWDCL